MKARRIVLVVGLLLLSCLACGWMVMTPSYRAAKRDYDEWLRQQDAGVSGGHPLKPVGVSDGG